MVVKNLCCAAAFTFVTAASAHAAHLQTIDSFSSGNSTVTVDQSNAPKSLTDTANLGGLTGVIGGYRNASMILIPPSCGANALSDNRGRLTVEPANNLMTVSNDLGIITISELTYRGSAANDSLNANFLAGGADTLRINFLRSDLPVQVRMTLVSQSETNNSTFTVNLVSGSGLTPFSLDVPYALFSGSGIAFSDIDRLTLSFNPGLGGDFALGGIGTIPTPGALAMLGIGGCLISSRRRRASR